MSGVKLTKAQFELLHELPTHVVPEYRPAQALIKKGMAVWHDDQSTLLDPTPSGLQALGGSNDPSE